MTDVRADAMPVCDSLRRHSAQRRELQKFERQRFMAFSVLRINGNTVHWTNLDTLWLLKMPNALCAPRSIDNVDFPPWRNRIIRTFGFADIAVDALISNH